MLFRSGTQNLKGNPLCNAEDNLRAGHVVIEYWFGATEGVLDYGVLGRPGYAIWAGLMGREDTR